jgi:hypothetical protein
MGKVDSERWIGSSRGWRLYPGRSVVGRKRRGDEGGARLGERQKVGRRSSVADPKASKVGASGWVVFCTVVTVLTGSVRKEV